MQVAAETVNRAPGSNLSPIDTTALRLELESKLLEHETSLQETIERKTAELSTQRVKIKQYEFALQESLVFLAKPLNKYEEWINSQGTEDLDFEFSANIASFSGVIRKASEIEIDPKSIVNTRHAKSTSASPSISQEKTKQIVTHVIVEKSKDLSELEINCMESMRLCFNFLKSCKKLNKAIDDGAILIPEQEAVCTDNESMSLMSQKASALEIITDTIQTVLIKATSEGKLARAISKRDFDTEVVEGDMSLEPLDDFRLSSASPVKLNQCDNCRSALLLLDTFKEKLQESEKKNAGLELRLHKEIAARKITQQGKDMIDREIEDITAELFARANQMVIDESKRMDALSTSNRDLVKKNMDLQLKLNSKENELSKSIEYLYRLQSNQISDKSFTTDRKESFAKVASPAEVQNLLPSQELKFFICSGFDLFKSNVVADGFIFQEFQEFMRAIVLSANLPVLQAFQSIHGTNFMRRSMLESVEPCLYYAYSPTSSFKLGQALAQSNKKKLLDAVIKGHVAFTPQEGDKAKCCLCSITRVCEYKLSISQEASNTSCRSCRDRVMAVQDFFVFIIYLSTGKHTSTILATFKQIIWIRRRMGLSVVGSCSLFESELTSIVGPGSGGNWEKDTETLY